MVSRSRAAVSNSTMKPWHSLAFLLLFACHEDKVTFPNHLPTRAAAVTPNAIGQPCKLLTNVMSQDAGAGATDCQQNARCAGDAIRERKPFMLCSGSFGMDSWIENGVAGLPGGGVAFYYFDTLGPATRGTCLNQNVKTDAWPVCTSKLVAEVDLRKGVRQ